MKQNKICRAYFIVTKDKKHTDGYPWVTRDLARTYKEKGQKILQVTVYADGFTTSKFVR